ncbi:elongator complex protein 4 [Microdochium bolleyi]|uniref:Elongator complex protein 4 n=1 Tax=Microdochium bolleyi TaxID=196109 RepID=A0A136JDJ2_9PEZI|nr:elongator complex protein 4 [Microdochium bolleyi]
MSFRKRNAVISTSSATPVAGKPTNAQIPGVRPSPYDSRPTTSTGTPSLDNILAGHAGMPMGTSLLIHEHGTTDFAGILVKYYAAEGLVQGHQVHVLGLHDGWKNELPGIASASSSSSKKNMAESPSDKMKIAWRYETLGSAAASRERNPVQHPSASGAGPATVFCHSFDLSKKLSPGDVKGQVTFYPSMAPQSFKTQTKAPPSPLRQFIRDLSAKIASSPSDVVYRIVVPGLLSPTAYAGSSCRPEEVLQFLHALRALLRQYAARLTALITVPVSLYPRSAGVTRWMEILSDGVLELIPLQSNAIHAPPPTSKSDSKSEDQTQGLMKVHSLPIFHEKGGGSSESYTSGEDQSFSLSRSKGLVIRPFSLPPVGEEEEEKKKQEAGKSMDF